MTKRRKATLCALTGIALVNSNLAMSVNAIYNDVTINSKSSITKMEVYNASSLNVRKGPGTSYAKIGSLSSGQIVEVLSISNGWAKINFNNDIGYVSTNYLKSISTTKKEMVVICDILNVRSGSSTSYSKIGSLKEGDIVTVVQTLSNGWLKIEYNNGYGYVSNVNNKYLSEVSTSIPDNSIPDNSVPDTSVNQHSVTADINLRKTASWSGTIITVIKKGAIVDVESISNGWAKVNYNGNTGYTPSDYLIKIESGAPSNPNTPSIPDNSTPESSESDTSTPDTSVNQYSATADINLRKTASWSGAIITVIKKETIVDVESISNGWAKVNYNGSTGYVPSDYLVKMESDTSTANKYMIIKSDTLSVRSGAGTQYSKLGELKKGDIIIALDELSNGWVKIDYNGKTGYISNVKGAYLEEVDLSAEIEEANNVIDKINAICDISIDNKSAIDYARLAYNALSSSAQKLVTNISKLEDAENELNILLNVESVKVKYIIAQIDRLEEFTTIENASSQRIIIDAIDKNLENIHSSFITNISNLDRFNKIKGDVIAVEILRDEVIYNPEIQNLIADIESLPSIEDIQIIDKERILDIVTRFRALPEDIQTVIGFSSIEETFDKIESLMAEDVVKLIDNLPSINILDLSHKDLVVEARAKYDEISSRNNKLVTNISKLTELEIKILELENVNSVIISIIEKIDLLDKVITFDNLDATMEQVLDIETLLSEIENYEFDLITNLNKYEDTLPQIKILNRVSDVTDANDVINIINNIPEVINIQWSHSEIVTDARNAYIKISESEKQLVTNLDKLEEAENEIKRIENGINEVYSAIHRIPDIETLTLSDKQTVADARNLYNSYNEKVTYYINQMNIGHLLDAEIKIEKLESEISS